MQTRVKNVLSLDELERWFQAQLIVAHAGAAKKKLPPIKEVVLPSPTLQPKERVAIYSGMYFLRLLDCLAADYPTVHQLLGEEKFRHLVRAYLYKHPSRHYSLNVLGRKLPDFLNTATNIPRGALIRDVAKVECAMSEVFDAQQAPLLDSSSLANIPPEKWENAKFITIPALRVLALRYPVNALITAIRQELPWPKLTRKNTWIAVYRKEYEVWRMELTKPMYFALAALQAGKTLGCAIHECARVWPQASLDDLEADIFRWFREWSADGLFSSVQF